MVVSKTWGVIHIAAWQLPGINPQYAECFTTKFSTLLHAEQNLEKCAPTPAKYVLTESAC